METVIASRARTDGARRTWRDELDLIQRPLAIFLATLALSLLLAGALGWMRAQQDVVLDQAERTRQAASSRYHNIETEKHEIRVFQPRFLALKGSALVGGENRLAWIETIQLSQSARRLPSVAYDIEPQQPLAAGAPLALGDYELRGSRMRLQMGLVHELDLFNLLDDLRGAGRFTVQDCKLRRIDVPPDMPMAPRLAADCTLVWLSLAPKGTP
jgi:hypothetical protein